MIDLWFDGWVASLVSRIPILWPSDDAEFWTVLRKALVISGADQQIADEASHRLAQAPPKFAADVIDPLKKHIGDVFRERTKAGKGDPGSSRDSAAAASRDCPDCRGEGLTTRYRHNPDAPAAAVPCYCLCPLGRWIEGVHRSKDQDIHRRIVDLARPEWSHLRLGPVAWRGLPDNQHRYRRDEWDAVSGRPVAVGFEDADPDADAAPLGIVPLAARVVAGAAPRPSSAGVPGGLTPSQEVFLFDLGDHWRARLMAAPKDFRDEILADFKGGIDNERKMSAVRRIASVA